MLSISPNQIQYVLALDRTGSFSEAASACFVTQSTLSTMIKKLENQMEVRLFDRSSKPIKLTEEGKILISQLKVINSEYENLFELVQETKNEFHGTLKIGIIPTLAPFLLPLILDNLIQAYPNIVFNINEITTNEILNRLKTRDIDIGILSLPIEDSEFLQTSLFKEDFLVYDAGNASRKNKKYKIKDIDISRLWLLEEGHCLSSQIGKICHLKKKQIANGKLVFNSGSILSLLELVNANKGITLLPRLATTHSNIVDQKWVHNLQSPVPVRDIGLVTHKSFLKRRLFTLLEMEILQSVNPILKKLRNSKVIDPF